MKSTLFGNYNIIFCPAAQAAEHAERAEMCKMCVNEKRRMRSALFGLGVSILDFHFAAEAYLAPMGLVHFQRFWAGLWKMDRDFAPPCGGTRGAEQPVSRQECGNSAKIFSFSHSSDIIGGTSASNFPGCEPVCGETYEEGLLF